MCGSGAVFQRAIQSLLVTQEENSQLPKLDMRPGLKKGQGHAQYH